MIKKIFTASYLAFSFVSLAQEQDSVLIKKQLTEVQVNALRATEITPVSFTNISNEELEEQNLGQDLPFLLSFTPSIVSTSDAGAGVGYTGFRVRGSDPTRINVTINGIPLNDSESHGVYWVNMPDFASSVENIQIQRGVGTSTNGAGAFGASVNLVTNKLRSKAYALTSNTVGSYGTLKNNVEFGTGLISDKFTLDGRLSKIESEGYIDRASSNLKSLFLSGAYYGDDESLKLTVFSGKEITFQAWNGVPLNYLNDESLRTFNIYDYENEVDNYGQTHYHLNYTKALKENETFNLGLHYTKGAGYFEQFRTNDNLQNYGLDNIIIGNDSITSTNLIRRRWLDNDFYGTVFSYQNSRNNFDYTIGGAWNTYEGAHFGEIIWAQYASNSNIRDRYYDNDATKIDYNIYAKGLYKYNNQITLFGDIQKRWVEYDFVGLDQDAVELNDQAKFDFFNPKLGFYYDINKKSDLYASFAVANREPNRSDFVDSSPLSRPTHETLYDTELGYKHQEKNYAFSVNAYYMIYENQLVLTGQINDVGAYTRTNIDYSERMGLELEGSLKLNNKLTWAANATFSKNKIPFFVEYVDNWDLGNQQEKYRYQDTDIAFSPNLIWANRFNYQFNKKTNLQLISKYVGEQFIDNTSSEDRKLDEYLTHTARVSYNMESKLFDIVKWTFQVNNLLDLNYANNAWIYRFVSDGYDPRTDNPYVNLNSEGSYDMAGYFPQAKRNFLLGLTLGF